MRPEHLILVIFAGCTANDDIPAPLIATVMPDHAPPGVSVMITGEYFCQQPEDGDHDPLACAFMGSVSFDETPGSVGSYTDHEITAEVPALEPGSVDLVLTVAGRRSRTVDFLVDAQ